MMLPAILLKIHHEPPPPPVIRPELSRVAKHFKSVREAGKLIFDRDMVESLHLGLWARERRHFAVLTGLSGTGKTQLAIEYAKALTGEDGESKARICTIAVQPGWYDPTPLLGYVNPLGESRYNATEFPAIPDSRDREPGPTPRVRARRDEPVPPGAVSGADPQRDGA